MKLALLLLNFVLAAGFLGAQAKTELRFAVSDAAPPYSYADSGVARGVLKEILETLFLSLPQYSARVEPFPWTRAQLRVREGVDDGFVTFPSESRQLYARFSAAPLLVDDYSYLVYANDNPKRAQLDAARSFEDLRGLLFVSQESVEWEKENVPPYLARTFVINATAMLHMTFNRRSGDFFIMGPVQAVHYAKLLGYQRQLVIRKVDFIPHSLVPFHLGLRRSLVGVDVIMADIERAMNTTEFQTRRQSILDHYSRN